MGKPLDKIKLLITVQSCKELIVQCISLSPFFKVFKTKPYIPRGGSLDWTEWSVAKGPVHHRTPC